MQWAWGVIHIGKVVVGGIGIKWAWGGIDIEHVVVGGIGLTWADMGWNRMGWGHGCGAVGWDPLICRDRYGRDAGSKFRAAMGLGWDWVGIGMEMEVEVDLDWFKVEIDVDLNCDLG